MIPIIICWKSMTDKSSSWTSRIHDFEGLSVFSAFWSGRFCSCTRQTIGGRRQSVNVGEGARGRKCKMVAGYRIACLTSPSMRDKIPKATNNRPPNTLVILSFKN